MTHPSLSPYLVVSLTLMCPTDSSGFYDYEHLEDDNVDASVCSGHDSPTEHEHDTHGDLCLSVFTHTHTHTSTDSVCMFGWSQATPLPFSFLVVSLTLMCPNRLRLQGVQQDSTRTSLWQQQP